MPMEYSERPRTTYRSMRVSVLLILITVGLPGCAGAAGTSRPAAVRHPATNPTPPAGPESAEPDPGLADPSGHGGVASSPADADRTGWPGRHLGPWPRLPARNSPETPEPAATPGPATRPDDRDSHPAPPGPVGQPGGVGEQRAAPPPPTGGQPPGYQRSLAYSGLFGLVISAVGLVMVGSRRRYW